MNEELEEQLTGVPAQSAKSSSKSTASLLSEPSAVILPLPSKSILYHGVPGLEDILDGNIRVRPMTLRELELFLKPELSETGGLIDAVFNNCIKSDIDPRMLLTSDRSFILMWIRSNSFGDEYRFKIKCDGCSKTISTKIKVSKLPVTTLDEIHGERDENGNITKASIKKIKEPFSFVLPHSGLKVLYKLPRGIDEATQSNEQYYKRLNRDALKNKGITKDKDGRTVIRNVNNVEEEQETFIDEVDQTSLIDILMKRVVAIEGVPEDRIEDALTNMIAGDVSALQEKIQQADSGIDMRIVVKCPDPGCRTENRISVPFTESFFRSSL